MTSKKNRNLNINKTLTTPLKFKFDDFRSVFNEQIQRQ